MCIQEKGSLDDLSYMSNEAFLLYLRLQRESFRDLLKMIEDRPEFVSSGKRPQAPVGLQLMVFLYYCGTSGNSSNKRKIGHFLGISSGIVHHYIKRVSLAFCSLKDYVVFWPGPEERAEIGARMSSKYSFPFCVGIADGSLLPLTCRPTLDGEDYFTRKSNCAVNVLVICDDTAAIRAFTIG